MSLELKAELVMAVRDYGFEEEQRLDGVIDFTASDANKDGKILLRVITEPESKSGFVGVDAVGKMIETMKDEDYDKGVIISKRFTEAAKREIRRESIQMVSERFMPRYTPQKLYSTIQHYIDDLCRAKCGKVPEKEFECKGYSNGCYSCKIRLISDNASFHFERGWINLLQKDLIQLLAIRNSLND